MWEKSVLFFSWMKLGNLRNVMQVILWNFHPSFPARCNLSHTLKNILPPKQGVLKEKHPSFKDVCCLWPITNFAKDWKVIASPQRSCIQWGSIFVRLVFDWLYFLVSLSQNSQIIHAAYTLNLTLSKLDEPRTCQEEWLRHGDCLVPMKVYPSRLCGCSWLQELDHKHRLRYSIICMD